MSTIPPKPLTPYETSVHNLKRITYTLQKHLKYFKNSYILLQDDTRYLDMWVYEKGMLGLINFMTVTPPDIKCSIKLEQLDIVDTDKSGNNCWNDKKINHWMLKNDDIDYVRQIHQKSKRNNNKNINNHIANNNVNVNININDIQIEGKHWNHQNIILNHQPKTIKNTINECKIQQQQQNLFHFDNGLQKLKQQYNNQQQQQSSQNNEYSHEQYQNYSNPNHSPAYIRSQQNSNFHREYKRGPYKNYTTEQKQRAVKLLIEDKLSVIQISRKLGIPCKNIKRWSQQGVQRKKGGGRKKFSPETERAVAQYFRKKYKQNTEVMYEEVQATAREMSKDQNFKASRGWVVKFVDRQNLRSYFKFI